VDEISMVPEIFDKFFLTLKKLLPNMNFIIAGDYRQLLPVKDRVGGVDYKNSVALWELCNGNRIQLSKCRRSDDTLFNLCKAENIKHVKQSQFSNAFTDVHLSFLNQTRKDTNEQMMKKKVEESNELTQSAAQLPLLLAKLHYDPNSQDVQLLAGTPIMARVTHKQLDIFNNETFIIDSINYDNKTINIYDETNERTFPVLFHDFQKFCCVA
jgi:ATP-dependent exoDNAse (exonuclease V) alpha subunit